jgi:hypothetical protein
MLVAQKASPMPPDRWPGRNVAASLSALFPRETPFPPVGNTVALEKRLFRAARQFQLAPG